MDSSLRGHLRPRLCRAAVTRALWVGRGDRGRQFVSRPFSGGAARGASTYSPYLNANPNQFLSKWMLGDRQTADPVAFVEYTAAFNLVAVAIIAIAVVRTGFGRSAGGGG